MRITGGTLKNQPLKVPKGGQTRPTSEKVRQSIFNSYQHYIEGANFLDLFAGSGAMGIEALSRGAKSATFIEKNPSAFKTLEENLSNLDLFSQATVLKGDVFTLLKRLKGETFDLIYIDPPYEQGLAEKALLLLDEFNLLHSGGIALIEEAGQRELSLPSFNHFKMSKKRKIGSTLLYEFTRSL
ncbi:MAG: 16S rRNA (guanine(966)-N(2))-methyltransferase RsmD [Chlamydiia bacterium]|nr:16S rRNA (guanine(966)-N(2))-methyltransferase RsmD [Chlamydiia bacterium]